MRLVAPPTADVTRLGRHVRLVPKADLIESELKALR